MEHPPLADGQQQHQLPQDEYFYSGYYYPHLPVVRMLPKFEREGKPRELEKVCTKHPYASKKRGPGILACICLDCTRIVGFNAMHEYESARSVFEVLYSRWQQAPEVVVYDNACNLSIYSNIRDPVFF